MVKVVNKVKDELEKLPHFTVSYGIKIGSDRESWLELESSNLGQGRESESEYWNKVTRPFPSNDYTPQIGGWKECDIAYDAIQIEEILAIERD